MYTKNKIKSISINIYHFYIKMKKKSKKGEALPNLTHLSYVTLGFVFSLYLGE